MNYVDDIISVSMYAVGILEEIEWFESISNEKSSRHHTTQEPFLIRINLEVCIFIPFPVNSMSRPRSTMY